MKFKQILITVFTMPLLAANAGAQVKNHTSAAVEINTAPIGIGTIFLSGPSVGRSGDVLETKAISMNRKNELVVVFRPFKRERVTINDPACSFKYIDRYGEIKSRDFNGLKYVSDNAIEISYASKVRVYDNLNSFLEKRAALENEGFEIIAGERIAAGIDFVTDGHLCVISGL